MKIEMLELRLSKTENVTILKFVIDASWIETLINLSLLSAQNVPIFNY